MNKLLLIFLLTFLISCSSTKTPEEDSRKANFPQMAVSVIEVPNRRNVWVFLLAGQSNMAGRGLVAPEDTLSHPRILTVDSAGQLVYAKEPLHYYEPDLQGLDCGLSFGKRLLSDIPDSISLLLLPTAVGGSSVEQWLGDSLHRGVKLYTNFKEKVEFGAAHGDIKAILWHQGESNANPAKIPTYPQKLSLLIQTFREFIVKDSLPVLIGELPAFPKNFVNRQKINRIIHDYAENDAFVKVIYTQDLLHKGDSTHFDADGQRKMGIRFAEEYLDLIK